MRWLLILVLWNGRRVERLLPKEPTETVWHQLTNRYASDIRSADCVEVAA